jgi:hypothetical protein
MASLNPDFLTRRNVDSVEHLETDLLSLDDFCRDRSLAPDLLKIDVEGHETAVLEGAHETLRRLPTLLVEISTENARSGEVGRLFSLGYTAYVIGDRKLLPLPSHEELVEIAVGTDQVDCLFTSEPSSWILEYSDGHASDQRLLAY